MCGATAVQCSTKYGSYIYIKQAEVSMSKIALVGLKFDVTPPHHRQGVCGVLHSAGMYVYSSGRRCGGLCTHSQSMLSHTVNPATTTNCLPLPNSTGNALYSRHGLQSILSPGRACSLLVFSFSGWWWVYFALYH